MAWKRTRSSRGRRRKRARIARIPRAPRRTRGNMLVTKRFAQVQAAYFDTSLANVFNAYAFTLSSLPSYTEFTSLFDKYKICGVKYRFYVDNATQDSAFSLVTRNHTHFMRVWHVVDTNDNSVPANFEALQQYPGMRCELLTPSKPWTRWRYFRPKFASTVYGPIVNGYAVSGGYLNTEAGAGVPHYGIKYAFNDSQEYTTVYLQFWVYLSCKSVK